MNAIRVTPNQKISLQGSGRIAGTALPGSWAWVVKNYAAQIPDVKSQWTAAYASATLAITEMTATLCVAESAPAVPSQACQRATAQTNKASIQATGATTATRETALVSVFHAVIMANAVWSLSNACAAQAGREKVAKSPIASVNRTAMGEAIATAVWQILFASIAMRHGSVMAVRRGAFSGSRKKKDIASVMPVTVVSRVMSNALTMARVLTEHANAILHGGVTNAVHKDAQELMKTAQEEDIVTFRTRNASVTMGGEATVAMNLTAQALQTALTGVSVMHRCMTHRGA